MALLALMLGAAACSSKTPTGPSISVSPSVSSGKIDVGGYSLFYQCIGSGSPTVILEAGYGTGGTSEFFEFMPKVASIAHVCTYDRAGTGVSDPRPVSMNPVDGTRMASELHALLAGIGVGPPYVVVGHSFGGMIVRAFASTYPGDVTGMVLIDASSEPEIPVYRRMHAGAWIDHTSRVDIDAMVSQALHAPSLGSMPLVVITAAVEDSDPFLARVPGLERAFQARLARLSTNSTHVLAVGSGHFIHRENPDLVLEAIREVVGAARAGSPLPPCSQAFPALHGRCP